MPAYCDRFGAQRVIHRHLLRSLERAVDLFRHAHGEVAGEGVADGFPLVDLDVMADGAGNAVAGEAAIERIPLLPRRDRLVGDGVDHLALEQLAFHDGLRILIQSQQRRVVADLVRLLGIAGELIETELPLPHDAVAVQAQVLDHRGDARVQRLLGLELGEKDRIAAGEPHGRAAPFAVGSDVDQSFVGLLARGLERHVEMHPGRARGVAADALVRGEEKRRPAGAAGPDTA